MYVQHTNLQIPDPPRTSRAPARVRATQMVQDITPCKGPQQWPHEFLQALDLVTALPSRERYIIDAVNGLYSGLGDFAAHLPSQFDKPRLHMQLTLPGDLTKEKRLITADFFGGTASRNSFL